MAMETIRMRKPRKPKLVEQPQGEPPPERELAVRLYLPESVHREMRLEAAKEEVSMAVLARKWVMERLGHFPPKTKRAGGYRPKQGGLEES